MSAVKKVRIYLSPPHMSGYEETLVAEAFRPNWIAPLGPMVDAFEGKIVAMSASNSGPLYRPAQPVFIWPCWLTT